MIGNAHLDPVWLWDWPVGVDEALATCRTACDLLDEYPDLYITRGEAWVHLQIQKLDPELFARIADFTRQGKWQIVNGWWIQPDCNFPSAESFRKQAELGKRYFKNNLGIDVTVGYNVDSFGHNAFLPMLLQQAEMDSYIFMRPKEQEKHLPTNLFIWKSPDNYRVTAFRLAPSYCTNNIAELEDNVKQSINNADRELGHTMCFYGIGDHGGGPSREQIDWIIRHKNYSDDVELRLSYPRAFFDIIKQSGVKLPEITGELQYHAVGCYTVIHQIKQQMRRAELLANQAEILINKYPDLAETGVRKELDRAWEYILFNQFHDILGGSSIASAYDQVRDRLGLAKTIATKIIVDITRRKTLTLPSAEFQQMIIHNISNRHYKGYVEFEPYLRGSVTSGPFYLTEQDGTEIPFQAVVPEAAADALHLIRLLFPVDLAPLSEKQIQIRKGKPAPLKQAVEFSGSDLSNSLISAGLNDCGINSLKLNTSGSMLDTEINQKGISISAFEDFSDTWSHNVSFYQGKLIGLFKAFQPWQVKDKGPQSITLANTLFLSDTPMQMQIVLQAAEPLIRLRLRMNWHHSHQIVKLTIPLKKGVLERYDGCPGGFIKRPLAAQEFPMHNFTALKGKNDCLAVVSLDTYGLDVTPDNLIRITLLRSPCFAHHDPFKLPEHHFYPVTDQGIHEYEIALLCLPDFSPDAIMNEVHRQAKPIWINESTRGVRQLLDSSA